MPMPPMRPQRVPYGQPSRTPPVPYGAAQAGPRSSAISIVLGVTGLLAGAAVAASTFLSWLSVSGLRYAVDIPAATGWNLMRTGSDFTGNSIYLMFVGDGSIFFTGFFSLLLGALLILGAFIIFFRQRAGGAITLAFSALTCGVAGVNVAMVYTNMPSFYSPAVGLWLFLGAAIVALVVGIVGIAT